MKIKNRIINIIDNFENKDKLSDIIRDGLLNIEFGSKEYEFFDDKFLISENFDINELEEIINDYLELKTDDINIVQNKIKYIINDFELVFNSEIPKQIKMKLNNIMITDENIDYNQLNLNNLIISKSLLKIKNNIKLKGILYEYIFTNIKNMKQNNNVLLV